MALQAKVVTLMNKGKTVVEYPRTVVDAIYDFDSEELLSQMLSKTAISVNTIYDRDRIPISQRANRKLVRVDDDGTGKCKYYTWDATNAVWDLEDLSLNIKSIDDVPEVIRNSITWKKLVEE